MSIFWCANRCGVANFFQANGPYLLLVRYIVRGTPDESASNFTNEFAQQASEDLCAVCGQQPQQQLLSAHRAGAVTAYYLILDT